MKFDTLNSSVVKLVQKRISPETSLTEASMYSYFKSIKYIIVCDNIISIFDNIVKEKLYRMISLYNTYLHEYRVVDN